MPKFPPFTISSATLEVLTELPLVIQGLYLYLHSRARYSGKHRGTLHITHRDLASELKISRNTLTAYIHTLTHTGLVLYTPSQSRHHPSKFTFPDMLLSIPSTGSKTEPVNHSTGSKTEPVNHSTGSKTEPITEPITEPVKSQENQPNSTQNKDLPPPPENIFSATMGLLRGTPPPPGEGTSTRTRYVPREAKNATENPTGQGASTPKKETTNPQLTPIQLLADQLRSQHPKLGPKLSIAIAEYHIAFERYWNIDVPYDTIHSWTRGTALQDINNALWDTIKKKPNNPLAYMQKAINRIKDQTNPKT